MTYREVFGVVLLSAASALAPVWADNFDYDTRRAPALLVCDRDSEHGRVAAARTCYQALLRSTRDGLVRAEAQWALGDVKSANDEFRALVNADARALQPRLRWGRLFLATHQYADAVKLFQEALAIDAQDKGARLAMARVMAERYDGDVRKLLATLLEEDPTLIEGQLLMARVELENGKYDAAATAAAQALKLAEQQQRAPLEAWSQLAAIELARGADTQRWTGPALAYNPRYGDIFASLAHFEVMRRRYLEASVWLRQAVQVQPDLWTAHEELGVNQLRLGDREGARVALTRAYSGDPFSATTVNTLRLLDSLEQFNFERMTQPDAIMQLHKKESAALRPYVEQLMRESMATFGKRYGYTPNEPVTVELYPDHDDFAVRIAGLPGIGLLGVTFGHLVAMDSPSGRQTGEFHWGSTLWHEMAHVYTLSVTDHRVPRWLSEGISVFEEWRTGPTPGVSLAPPVLTAFAEGKFLPVAQLDEGFIRPSYPEQVQVSYMQAGLICLFIEERWGFDKLASFLRQFTRDNNTAAAVQANFAMEPAAFDKEFTASVQKRFAPYLADPKKWLPTMQRAAKALEARDWKEASSASQQAVALLPEFTPADSPYLMLAKAQEGAGDSAAATATLLAWRKAGGWDPDGLRWLAKLLLQAQRPVEATAVLDAVNYADPLRAPGHAELGELLLTAGKAQEAVREYSVLLALDPLDTAAANFGLARAWRLAGDLPQSRRRLLEALETAPNYRPAQKLLLEMTGDPTP
ncbi:MAG: tetratricopeptide repeat protein [Pseudomonadota bacterium]